MNNQAFNFQILSPDLIIDALESVGIRVDYGLTALNSYENRVYQFMDESRKRYVVKFYRPERWNAAQIEEEHIFSLELSNMGIPIIPPLLLNDHTLHKHGGFFFAVFLSIGGRQYEMDNIAQLEWVGRFLGRIHQTGKGRLFLARPTLGIDEYLTEPRQLLACCELIPVKHREGFFAALDLLIATSKQYWNIKWHPLRLHGDCHPGNILWHDGPIFVDLDDARNGPAIQDLWMLLHGTRAEQLIQLDALLESYEEFTNFDQRELALIEPLRAMRMVYYLAWVARRWCDPAFPNSFPWMAESDFWLRQTATFTEQTRLLQDPPLQLVPMY